MHRSIWRPASLRLIPSGILFITGALFASVQGNINHGSPERRFLAAVGVLVFVFFSAVFLHVITKAIRRLIVAHHLGVGRAAAIQFGLRVIGYIVIVISTMSLLGIPVTRLIVGGAALGIILGVAAQQALANFFASIVLILSHPFTVGEEITVNSGSLGGQYKGTVMDIGLTHTRLKDEAEQTVFLPNTALLSSAAIVGHGRKPVPPPTSQA